MNLDKENNRCVEGVPEGYTVNTEFKTIERLCEGSCEECSTKCSTCLANSPQQCESCKDGYVKDEKSKVCIASDVSCLVGEYRFVNENTKKVQCSRCHQDCLECNGKTSKDCTKCSENQILV